MEQHLEFPRRANRMNQQSEVARLRARIEQEHAASVWALTGLASGALRHNFIQRRLEHMGVAQQSLARLIGEEQATALLCEVFERTPEQR